MNRRSTADEAAVDIERAARWAVRHGLWHIDADGALVKDWDEDIRAMPIEWRPAA